MKFSLKAIAYYMKDYVVILIGLLLYAVGWKGFLLPNDIVTGGITGVSSILYFTLKIPVNISYAAINVALLLLAVKILGFQFCIRTIIGVGIMTVLLSVLNFQGPILEDQSFMSSIIGAMMCGAGIGAVFISNGSTGGTDIIVAMINKYKNVSFGRLLLFIDFFIVTSSFFIFDDVEKLIFSYVVMGVMTYTCDMVINGLRQSVQIMIFSEKYEEIATHINSDINRGVTVLDGTGWYSKQPKKVIVVLAKRNESVRIFRLVKAIDSNAFISQANVLGVYGKGFDNIKT